MHTHLLEKLVNNHLTKVIKVIKILQEMLLSM